MSKQDEAQAWSPSAAREAARAALRRYLTKPEPYGDLAPACVALLEDDRAFDSPATLDIATITYIPHEVRAYLGAFIPRLLS